MCKTKNLNEKVFNKNHLKIITKKLIFLMLYLQSSEELFNFKNAS